MKCATLAGALLTALWAWPSFAQIQVTAGTYGGNVSPALHGNATTLLSAACNGQMTCGYVVNYFHWAYGLPPGPKDFKAEWTCTGDPTPRSATVPAEAGLGSVVNLSCSTTVPTPVPTTVPTPTPTPAPTPPPTPPAPTPTPPPGPTPAPPPVPPTPTPGVWPTIDPHRMTVMVWCEQGEPRCLPGGMRWWWGVDPTMHVQIVTPTP